MPQQNICYNCFKGKENNTVCPYCGYSPEQDMGKYPLALSHGTILGGRYIIGRVLGQGGFGITYVAQDYQTKELVAIKEYFPDTLATRSNTHSVSSSSREREGGFCYGKECFLDEAKTMAEFIGNPNIVRVYSYFEENNTAYFVMEYIEGISLKTYLDNNGGKINFEEAKRILLPVMDALSAVHSKGIIHRDISPDNIFITKDGTVKLIDFGAARYSLGDRSRSLDVILKHGYAPYEQYMRRGRQGPYTDVYSMAATFYKAITGRVPPESIERMEQDRLIMPSTLGVCINPKAEDALLKGLEVISSDRFQSMAEFKTELTSNNQNVPVIIDDEKNKKEEETKDNEETVEVTIVENNGETKEEQAEEKNEKTEVDKEKKKINLKKILTIAIPSVAVVLVAVFIFSFVIKPYVFDVPVATDNVTEPSSLAEDILDKSLANEDNGVNASEVEKATESSNEKTDSAQSSSSKATSSKSSSSKATSSKSSSSKTTSSQNSSSKTTSSTTSSSKTASSKSSTTNTSKTTSSKSSTASSSKATSSKASSSKATSSKSSTTSSKSSTASSNSIEKDFYTEPYNGGVEIIGYTGSVKNLTIPSKIGGKSVTAIGDHAFLGRSFTSVTVPDSVTEIAEYAFNYCENLTSVSMPNSIKTIGEHAFENCKSLTNVTIPNGVTTIRYSTFFNCTSLTSVTIPNSVTEIKGDAFLKCTSLTSITIPDSVTIIEKGAFDLCISLKKVSLPKNCKVADDEFSDDVIIERRS